MRSATSLVEAADRVEGLIAKFEHQLRSEKLFLEVNEAILAWSFSIWNIFEIIYNWKYIKFERIPTVILGNILIH